MEIERHHHGEDILVEVLCRLPKKSLARFKCVSKQWLTLISDRNRVFAKTSHAGLVCQTFLPFRLRSRPSSSAHPISVTDFLRLDNMGKASSCHTPSQLPNDDNLFIVASCDGFLLYSGERRKRPSLDLVVSHPTTNRSWNLSVLVRGRGLCFGLASDGHHFIFAHFLIRFGGGYILDLFSSENEEWIQKVCHLPSISIPPAYYVNLSIDSMKSVFLDGSFHWIWEQYLVIYHLGDAGCRLLKFPPLPKHNGGCIKRLYQCIWESEGCVNYCRVSASGRRIGIWNLLRTKCSHKKNEYSFGWKLKHWGVLPPPPSMPEIMRRNAFSPFSFNDDFEIVYLMCRKRVFSYSLATTEMKEICTSPFEDSHARALCIALPFLYLTRFNTTITDVGDRELSNPCSDKIRKRKYQRLP